MTTIRTTSMTTILLEAEKPQPISLETVKYSELLEKDALEITTLLRSCQSPGFFYLDISGMNAQFDGDAHLDDLDALLQQQEEYFALPHHDKMNHHQSLGESGYQYTLDRETFGMTCTSFRVEDIPSPLDAESMYFAIAQSHAIATNIVRSLSPFLGNEDVRKHVTSIHDDCDISPSGIRLENYWVSEREKQGHRDVSEYTDRGSLALRYCDGMTIEYWDTGTGRWVYLEPRRDCLIVSVGGVLQAASKGQFQSPLHRVGYSTTAGELRNRQCVTYQLWPADGRL